MAALISGTTFHSWGEIPIDLENAGQREKRSVDEGYKSMFLKCAGIRWILIDEISTAGLMILGLLEKTMRKSCSSQLHATDGDGDERCWGGVNIIICGDWWQLQAVMQKSICRNPFLKDCISLEARIRDMFWQFGAETIPSRRDLLFELVQQVRSKDKWLNCVLASNRIGEESWEMYCFTHGLPTEHVGSWLPNEEDLPCGSADCAKLQTTLWRQLWLNGASWLTRQRMECEACQKERLRRCRALATAAPQRQKQLDDFAAAPYIHPFNQPRYHALICHALHFAKTIHHKIYWIVCLDWPLTTDEENMSNEDLQKLRLQWLGYHDQHTGGVMGLLPLAQDMPLRMSATVYEGEVRLYKHRSCILRGLE
jgi:hypothetical protein